MYNRKYHYKGYCKEIEKVENYEKAKADNFVNWVCHHRLQTWTSDGKRREVNISAAELIALDMYYNRPAEELIFMTVSEHKSLHSKGNKHNLGKPLSEEHRRKISESHKGKPKTEEHKKHLSEALKGKPKSEEHRKKNSEVHKGNTNTKGIHWYNNGIKNIMSKECPEGFTPGRLRK